MELFVLGTSGMMPLPGRFLTSLLLRREGSLFLFDCGEGTQVAMRRLNLKWKKISAIFISHTHADHVTGLPGMLMLSSQVERSDPLVIIGPPKIREYVETSRKVLDMYINYDIEVREIENPGQAGVVYQDDEFDIYSFPLKHSKVCVGYSLVEKMRPGVFFPKKAEELQIPKGPLWATLQSGESIELANGRKVEPSEVMGEARKGRKFSFVTDTLYAPHIAPYVADSDLFICEGMFDSSLAESAAEKKHLTAAQAGRIAREAGSIKRMGLIHYSPRYTEKELSLLLDEAQKEFKETFLCKERMVVPLSFEE